MITRTSKHILKFANQKKLQQLDRLYFNYKEDLYYYIKLILSQQLPLRNFLTSKDLPVSCFIHSGWRQTVYQNASQIVRSSIQYITKKRYNQYKKAYTYFKKVNRQQKFLSKRFSDLKLKPYLSLVKIDIKNITINIRDDLFSYRQDSKHFDEFVSIRTPYFQSIKHRAIQVRLPIKYHKQSLKYNSWKRKNTVQLKKINNNFYLCFIYEKEFKQKERGNVVGYDIGYNKLLADSNGNFYGKELKQLYQRISDKKQGSNNFKGLLKYRDDQINKTINQLPLQDINRVYVEDLKSLYYKTKIATKVMNKLQRLRFSKVLLKIEMNCEEQGILCEKVSPKYTSQTCSHCGAIHKNNRLGEKFKCIVCNVEMDADHNAAINILHRGVYHPSTKISMIHL